MLLIGFGKDQMRSPIQHSFVFPDKRPSKRFGKLQLVAPTKKALGF